MNLDCTGIQKETIHRYAVCTGSDRILDLGCGSGRIAAGLSEHVNCVIGVDPVESSVQAARRGCPGSNVWFQVGRAEALCYATDFFDSVIMNESLHHVPMEMQLKALQECQRVLRPEGRLLILEPVRGKGASGKILEVFEDETESSLSAIEAIGAVIGSEFRLSLKIEIRAFFSCGGFDDLYGYCTASHSDERRSEAFTEEVKGRLDRCERASNGDYLIDYYDTVWLLTKP